MTEMTVVIVPCTAEHLPLVPNIVRLIEQANQEPGNALARRSAEEITDKILKGLSVVALSKEKVVGFVFVSPWENEKFVSTSGLVVNPDFRSLGIARRLKQEATKLIELRFPDATPFGLTLSGAIMKLNASLGFIPVSYDEITTDDGFWAGCESCPYVASLKAMKRERCFCTAMIRPRRKSTLSR